MQNEPLTKEVAWQRQSSDLLVSVAASPTLFRMTFMLIWTYGSLALLGAIVPWFFNAQFIEETGGFALIPFLELCFANPAAASISVDLVIGASAFTVWMISEGRRLRMPRLWVYIVLTFTVAFACAAPLFLLMRERHLKGMAQSPTPS